MAEQHANGGKDVADIDVVFVHGFLDEGSFWKDVADQLGLPPDHIHIVDLPGMGAQSDWSKEITLPALRDDVLKGTSIFDLSRSRVAGSAA